MKLGMNVRNWGPTATRDFLTACATAADRSTLDAIWFNDHVGFPPVLENNPYGVPAEMGNIIDPLGFACYLAGITERIHFGTGVLVVPYRPAILTNKLLTAIQVLSGNRFLLGIGPGYLDEEFRALGVNRKRRGKITDEILQLLQDSSKDPVVTVNEQAIKLEPKLPLPPIYVGGNSAVAIPRAVKLGHGWMPVGAPPQELADPIKQLQQAAAAAGRKPLEVVQMKTLPLEDMAAAEAMAVAYRDVGVTHLVHTQGYDSPAHFSEIIEQVTGPIRQSLS